MKTSVKILIIIAIIFILWFMYWLFAKGKNNTINSQLNQRLGNKKLCYKHNFLGNNNVNNSNIYEVSVYGDDCKMFDEIKFTNSIEANINILTSKNPPYNIASFIKKIEDSYNVASDFKVQIKQKTIC